MHFLVPELCIHPKAMLARTPPMKAEHTTDSIQTLCRCHPSISLWDRVTFQIRLSIPPSRAKTRGRTGLHPTMGLSLVIQPCPAWDCTQGVFQSWM